jgi:hypothetical protein
VFGGCVVVVVLGCVWVVCVVSVVRGVLAWFLSGVGVWILCVV